MELKKNPKKRKPRGTVTFDPVQDVKDILKPFASQHGAKSRIINEAILMHHKEAALNLARMKVETLKGQLALAEQRVQFLEKQG